MSKKEKIKRMAAARIIHVGCAAIDSTRILTWGDVMKGTGLTEKEQRLLRQRYEAIRDRVAEARQLARHMEKTCGFGKDLG